jgi:hypothetical protein
MPAQKLVRLSQQIVHVAKNFEFKVIGQVFLQVTIATSIGQLLAKLMTK